MIVGMCAEGASAVGNINEEKLIPNFVKEKGGVDCYLFLRQKASAAYTLYGLWSPDSINIK